MANKPQDFSPSTPTCLWSKGQYKSVKPRLTVGGRRPQRIFSSNKRGCYSPCEALRDMLELCLVPGIGERIVAVNSFVTGDAGGNKAHIEDVEPYDDR
jgi:hypothetical protein